VGSEKGGVLTEAVRRKPYSVVLFDEIEKAHPDVLNILLQITEDGFLTDAQGKRINFRNCIIILTSNIGAELLTGQKSVGFFGQNTETTLAEITKELKKHLRPELINRLDKILLFKKLTKENLAQIAENMCSQLIKRAKELELTVNIDKSVYELLANSQETEQFGARPLRRRISEEIEPLIANLRLENTNTREIFLIVENDKVVIKNTSPV
jgi:ATP-dependent Clp protease ATP-binding subunit ClpC